MENTDIFGLCTSFQRPITTICWGHRDSRLFLACGPALYVVRVEHRVASLQLLCKQGIASALREEKDVGKLNMPSLLCSYVTTAFIPTIKVLKFNVRCCLGTCLAQRAVRRHRSLFNNTSFLQTFSGSVQKRKTADMFSFEFPSSPTALFLSLF